MCCIDKLLAPAPLDFAKLIDHAYQMLEDEIAMNLKMAELGAALINDGDGVLTICNTGSLATPGVGTALGVIRVAHRQGKKIHCYFCATRPLLQGARLTAYELLREGIPCTLICDSMAATVMKQGKIQRVFAGSDRICRNGDFANKIGTFSLAVLAKYHNIPFHGVAPVTTVDFDCPHGDEIEIELRDGAEVRGVKGSFGAVRWAPEKVDVFNPAFDVTPHSLVTSLILDKGIVTREELEKGGLLKFKE
jgi:methylthioribose-1-phosphate isomerase